MPNLYPTRLPGLPAAANFAVFATIAVSMPVFSQSAPQLLAGSSAAGRTLDEISVTATRSETAVARTPSSISVIGAETIDEQQPKDVKDLLRYEPGVTVRRGPYRPSSAAAAGGRGGNEGINIRGLEGNRILLMEDGIRLPSSFSFGPLEAGRGDYMQMDMYKRVEILRGPASAMYGSDGLTGAVNFITKDPSDFLKIFNKPTYFSIKPVYDSTDGSTSTTAVAAFGGERFEGLLIANKRTGHEVDTKGTRDINGPNRDTANPQNVNGNALLGKLVFKASGQDTFTAAIDHQEQKTDSNVLSAVTASTLALRANDKLERNRYSLAYDFKDGSNPYFQNAHAQIYYQDAKNHQFSYEDRFPAADRTRDNTYRESTYGGSAQAESGFATGGLQHKLVYGFDLSTARISGLRDGTIPGVGESPFPNKAFPNTDYSLFGAFIQDEIRLSPTSPLSITPGLRFDGYRLTPDENDPAYTGKATKSSGNAVSPRLALMVEISPALLPYIQYARGFRTPTPDQVNNSFGNPIFGYATIGNPDLKPETSNTFEIGLRGKLGGGNDTLRYSVAAFTGRYSNFISQEIVSGSGRPFVDPFIYQYVNRARARISGAEARIDWQQANGLGFKAGMAYTKGHTEGADGSSTPLDTVNPFMAVFGLRYEPSELWYGQTDFIYQSAKRRSDMSKQSDFAPPAAFVVDLRGGYNISKNVSLFAGIHNLFNRQYWNWSDVRGLAGNTTVADAYTAPGRSFNVGLKFQY
ncbi:tonB-dependent hemoglobin/transferrin/lactoferrin receptor family protein [Collimonas fungivorans]|uniref:TonB-dependent hemoglobin/transferrin/lactoferrin receptor family protein n=1 Tax=Collimonas fungivorans TaxID=158899 RepID=A0A127PEX1_9BURK|nr:TonB-dependent hemoglobin/transferrin/lactoferrin family receptor [Collimonas fungivorans]AMO96265.1 tonB-dependent hemoglobin/transferrin/lactoferrin receptor family protein [Collimonas fungivorans]